MAQKAGVDFHYAISPGDSICFSSAEDFACLAGKLQGFYRLGVPESERLDQLAAQAQAALQAGESPSKSAACARLDAYLESLDEACYHLRNRMENLALRGNLLPLADLARERMAQFEPVHKINEDE